MATGEPPAAAFYEPLGDDRFAGSSATAGPWAPEFQHAGPVSALLGRAFERHGPGPGGGRVGRVTVEILAPVPVAPLRVTTRVVRPGKRVALLEGELAHEGRTVARATAWRITAAPEGLEPIENAPVPPPLPPPDSLSSAAFEGWAGMHLDGYLSSMEWRFVRGSFSQPGPGEVWARAKIPLVAGEADSPLVRTLVLADSASGVGSQIDFAKWLVINTDLTVALHRDPIGEWLFMSARLHASPGGSALAESTLADTSGSFGRGLQTLLVDTQP
ncbi:thioesterase family protein [Actinomadura rudentiformis]|uniref:Thioesterase family protein n=1 Tax=Actinomadura rudentiformis TaxID=359158 RepID=A0A6H9YFR6_9ACTN|nr:thioesterase family protein [Actinomadura rudentiformis]KAB2337992.1 thioesterase family protein [Actinomadura rudentiformis]